MVFVDVISEGERVKIAAFVRSVIETQLNPIHNQKVKLGLDPNLTIDYIW